MADSTPLRGWDRQAVLMALEAAMYADVESARQQFYNLKGSLEGESKSTAGDKHETGRAMVQMEMEQAANRLSRLEGMMRNWSRLRPELGRKDVRPGALVDTSMGCFVIGVAWGGITMPNGEAWRAIGSDAPIALAMSGMEAGSVIDFRGRSVVIHAVA